ncbi:MAG TPA: aminopeptidase [Spirochaetia bacterium]|nr:aminopeptidase [Spirochaetia bacterium]
MKPKKIIFLILLPVFLFLLSRCYVVRQGYTLFKHRLTSEEIHEMLQEKDLSEKTKSFLKEVLQIKKFAVEYLGLSDHGNYETYIPIDRDYLIQVVSASRKDKFEDILFTFPIFGSFPYKGFYDPADAKELYDELKEEGLDVLIRKSDAYSTLGILKDPIYSFMENYFSFQRASLIIHEMVHGTVFIDNQADFNENLASFIEKKGAFLYIEKYYGKDSDEYQNALTRQKESKQFLIVMKKAYDELKLLYQEKLSSEEKLKKREEVFDLFKNQVMADYDKIFQTDRYRFIKDLKVNNAYLRLFMVYEGNQEIFEKLYLYFNQNIKSMMTFLKKLDPETLSPEKKVEEILTHVF